MQNIIAMEVLSATSEKGFSLDELVFKTKELFEKEGLAGFVGLILRLADERICMNMVHGKIKHSEQACCLTPQYEYHGQSNRQFRTSVGKVMIRWRRLRCTGCGKSIIPLRGFLGLNLYQSKTSELEKIVTEIVSEQTYRRSSSHLSTIGTIPVPKSTAHRWVAQSDCDQIDDSDETFDMLFADGTGYKRRPDKEAKLNNRGELRIALGVDKTGSIVPLGAFTGKSWNEIAAAVQGDRDDEKPIADMLVSDGERGIAESFAKLCNSHQRCHWHCVQDLNYTMWQDKAGKVERRQMQKKLAAIIGIEIPEEDYEKVDDSDKTALADAVAVGEYEIRKLIKKLLDKGYVAAADYLIRACKNMFSYIRRWLLTGIVGPRASSLIERMMREIARRLKRMAFGWSEQGAAKMARIIIKRFTSAGQWEKYWRKRLRIQDNVLLVLRAIKVKNPQTLGR
ncbi:MAG: hypothetical protein KAJ07_10875 [Planctomycetes bacterium]|nr:hypothetical protein [Planctomycetota bacterium]